MRILWLYMFDPTYDFDKWFHGEYVKYLTRHPGVEAITYGPRMHEGYPKLTPIHYRSDRTLASLHEEFPFDVVIANTKSRMFAYYSPFAKRAEGCWLPSDFREYGCPKIMIEEDYHYEENDEWYASVGFDFIFQRHYRSAIRGMIEREIHRRGHLRHLWLPFSVDQEKFAPNPSIPRTERLCLAASSTPNVYEARRMVYFTLKKLGLIDGALTQTWQGEDYVRVLQSYVSHVSCSSSYHITPAKMLEITSSQSVLFTNQEGDYGVDRLFPDDAYVTYKLDGTDLVAQAQRVLYDREWRDHVARRGRDTVLARHTHAIRTNEMLAMIQQETQ